MSTPCIDNALDQALAATEGKQSLQRFIAVFHRKHPALLVVEHGKPEQRLTAMLIQYCRLLPILLEEARNVTANDKNAADFDPLYGLVAEFFSSLEQRRLAFGILGILDKVYFGHRLLEEWHDRRRLHTQCAWLSWDMSLANLLVHTLIGDAYANELDAAVMEIIEKQSPSNSGASVTEKSRQQHQPYPCLASRHGVRLSWSR